MQKKKDKILRYYLSLLNHITIKTKAIKQIRIKVKCKLLDKFI